MKRRLNFTGRKKLPRSRVLIELKEYPDKPADFTAIIDLNSFEYDKDDRIFIEAYHKTDYRRFDFGIVSMMEEPEDTSLAGTGYLKDLMFRVKIVDKTGRILARADRIKPIPAEGEQIEPILPVRFDDLERLIWKVDIDELGPRLILNEKIKGVQEKARYDPEFFCYVYPAALREVLIKIFFLIGFDPENEWQLNWLKFSKNLAGETPETFDRNEEDYDSDEVIEWIDLVVKEFCNRNRKLWTEFAKENIDET